MFNVLNEMNYLSILAAFVPQFVLGGMWFTLFFKKPYAAALGKGGQDLDNNSPLYIVGPNVTVLIMTLTSAILITALPLSGYGDLLIFTMITGLGYLVANTVNIAINPNIPRPFFYSLITGSYQICGALIGNSILYLMK